MESKVAGLRSVRVGDTDFTHSSWGNQVINSKSTQHYNLFSSLHARKYGL